MSPVPDRHEKGSNMHTVLVPGLACSARLWDTLMPTAWARGGVTVADTQRDDTITGIARRLLADAPPRFVLAGISMGGYVSLEVMSLAPERVQALALISTAAAPDTPEQHEARRQQSELTRQGRYARLVEAAFPSLVDDSNRHDADLKDLWTVMAHEVGPDAFLTQQTAAMQRADTRPILAGIDCPTAVIHGVGDKVIPVHNAHETAAAIPDAQLTLLDGAGHMAAHERPAAARLAFAALFEAAGRQSETCAPERSP